MHEGQIVKTSPVCFFTSLLMLTMLLLSSSVQAMNCIALTKPQFVFGLYEPLSENPLDMDAQFLLYCQPASAGESLTLRIGMPDSAGIRGMQGAQYGDVLRFSIYRDPARSMVLNETTSININESLIGNKLISIPLYGRIFSRQNISADNYQSGIVVTLDY